MKYYVLWKKNNEMLFEYLNKYFDLLKSKLSDISKAWFASELINKLLNGEYRDFIMHPDNSSIINLMYANEILWRKDDINITQYQEIFLQELKLLFNGNIDKLTMNKWVKIWGTNILLTHQIHNPYDWKNPHPDHKTTGWILWYGKKDISEWINIYDKTFSLLRKVDEWVYDELNQIIKKIAPLWTAEWLHNSASYQEAIGDLYLGYTIDSQYPEINNLEAIIHESSHNKLNLILHFDPLILNDNSENYYSPYRPDARHIHGIYLGLHAFVPTMYILMKAFLSNQITDKGLWLEKIILYYFKNKISINVLEKHWKFTALGREILDEIKEVQKLTDKLFWELNVSNEQLLQLKWYAKEHFNWVNSNYKNLLY